MELGLTFLRLEAGSTPCLETVIGRGGKLQSDIEFYLLLYSYLGSFFFNLRPTLNVQKEKNENA